MVDMGGHEVKERMGRRMGPRACPDGHHLSGMAVNTRGRRPHPGKGALSADSRERPVWGGSWESARLNGWADPDGCFEQGVHAVGFTNAGASLAAGF